MHTEKIKTIQGVKQRKKILEQTHETENIHANKRKYTKKDAMQTHMNTKNTENKQAYKQTNKQRVTVTQAQKQTHVNM